MADDMAATSAFVGRSRGPCPDHVCRPLLVTCAAVALDGTVTPDAGAALGLDAAPETDALDGTVAPVPGTAVGLLLTGLPRLLPVLSLVGTGVALPAVQCHSVSVAASVLALAPSAHKRLFVENVDVVVDIVLATVLDLLARTSLIWYTSHRC